MNKLFTFYFLLFTLFISLLLAETIEIKQDGTGNFTTIQEGIDVSSNADTVLVYPGTYFENLNITNKNITLASLELITGDPQYISITVIDGQRIESCIWVMDCQTRVHIQGFTIHNGSGSVLYNCKLGGGILSYNSIMQIISNRITNNIAWGGGGLFFGLSDIELSNNIISNNSASQGGGIAIIDENIVDFDPINRNSIYNNNAGIGYDIFAMESNHIHVVVDTFSVLNPDSYYAKAFDQFPNFNTYFTFDINHGLFELIPQDLYVAQDGDDDNSGLTYLEPLRNISTAVRLIDIDENEQRTINVESGVYSWESNQQIFPFGFKENLSIIGEDASNTTIINDYSSGLFDCFDLEGNCEISNFSFSIDYDFSYILCNVAFSNNFKISNCNFTGESGDFFLVISETTNILLENINIYNASTVTDPCMILFDVNGSMNNVIMDNCNIFGNPDATQSTLYLIVEDSFNMSNSIFSNNYSSSSFYGNIGIAEFYPNLTNKQITNCLFFNNTAVSEKNIRISGVGTNIVSNCTFVDNSSSFATLNVKGNLELINSIMNNPENTYEILVSHGNGTISELDVSHCNILGGEDAVYNQGGVNIINWGEGNIDEDPLFLLSGDDPYQLSELSPCIDTGTPDTTGLYLPPWDLIHNYRVWDGDENGVAIIDMGCYEFGAPPVGSNEEVIPLNEINLYNYPNPFNPITIISFSIPNESKVDLLIYNIKGQKVKQLVSDQFSAGEHSVVWDGKDENDFPVGSGIYLYKLQTPSQSYIRKCILLK